MQRDHGPILEYEARGARFRFTRRQARWICWSLAAIPLVLFIVTDLGCGREARSIIWPWIDTVQASGYSESAFQTIKVGMTRQQVDAFMCKPLHVHTLSTNARGYVLVPPGASLDVGAVRYSYTDDGRCPWADFAWFGREVWFEDGVVREIRSDIYHD